MPRTNTTCDKVLFDFLSTSLKSKDAVLETSEKKDRFSALLQFRINTYTCSFQKQLFTRVGHFSLTAKAEARVSLKDAARNAWR